MDTGAAIDELRERLSHGDIAWVREHFHAGDLNALRDRLTSDDWHQVSRRIDAGDLHWLHDRLLATTPRPAAARPPAPPVVPPAVVPAAAAALRPPDAPPATEPQAPIVEPQPTTIVTPAESDATPMAGIAIPATVAPTPSPSRSPSPSPVRDEPAATSSSTTPSSAISAPRRRAWLVPLIMVTALALAGLAIVAATRRSSSTSASTQPSATAAPTTVATVAVTTAVATPTTRAPTTVTTSAPASSAAATASTTAATTNTTAGAAAASAPTTAPAPATTTTAAPTADVVATAVNTGEFVTLAKALEASGLDATLRGRGPFTLFAPTDAAFAKLPPATFDALLRDRATLKRILQYHVVNTAKSLDSLGEGALTTTSGDTITVATSPRPTVNATAAITSDLAATNGVVHVIDTVLVPPGLNLAAGDAPASATAAGDLVVVAGNDTRFSVLSKLLTAAGVVDTLKGKGPFTVFAPTDAAFERLAPDALDKLLADKVTLAKVLQYHVMTGRRASSSLNGAVRTVEGETLAITRPDGVVTLDGDAKVVAPDLAASNGTVHGIDRVVFPADVDATAFEVAPASPDFNVYFNTDSSLLRPDARAVIQTAAQAIKAGSTVIVTGVADRRGPTTANFELSARRARVVADALAAAGADATFDVRARGAEPAEDLQQARRVEIDIP